MILITRKRVVDSDSLKLHFHVGAAESATPTSISELIIMRLEIHMRITPKITQQELLVSVALSLRS